jgi:phosphatidate cytidylyltransferase
MTSSRPAKRFDWHNLAVRAVSAVVLIPTVLFAILSGNQPFEWLGHWPFIIMMTAAVAVLAIEWGGMSAPNHRTRVASIIALMALAAVYIAAPSLFSKPGSASWSRAWYGAWISVIPGAGVAALVAWRSKERPIDAAFGVLYIVGPCLGLIWLQAMDNPISWTVMLLTVTWTADISAFLVGNALKGPKLWPRYSPNKTWTGFFGGLVGAMAAGIATTLVTATAYFHGAHPSLQFAAMIGLAGGLATMVGDLWESALKRRYGVKDSGDLIPVHGGLLDRVDGLMFAALAVAGARLIHQIGWAQ